MIYKAGEIGRTKTVVYVYHSDATSAFLIGQTVSGTGQTDCDGTYTVIVPGDLLD